MLRLPYSFPKQFLRSALPNSRVLDCCHLGGSYSRATILSASTTCPEGGRGKLGKIANPAGSRGPTKLFPVCPHPAAATLYSPHPVARPSGSFAANIGDPADVSPQAGEGFFNSRRKMHPRLTSSAVESRWGDERKDGFKVATQAHRTADTAPGSGHPR